MSSVSIKIDHPKGKIRYPDNFPNKEGADQYRYGFTLYKEVIVQWDRDRDERIFSWYDSLPEKLQKHIIIIQEHEGMLYLVLDKEIKIEDLGRSWDVEGEEWKLAEDGVRVKGRGVAY
ncbi:MAG: hypothetical protein KAI34_05165 [Candidatus Lokiarchaeota archaeon]|nr:hypothetical protein [Candidatus Lokiarchaeota archaeon]